MIKDLCLFDNKYFKRESYILLAAHWVLLQEAHTYQRYPEDEDLIFYPSHLTWRFNITVYLFQDLENCPVVA